MALLQLYVYCETGAKIQKIGISVLKTSVGAGFESDFGETVNARKRKGEVSEWRPNRLGRHELRNRSPMAEHAEHCRALLNQGGNIRSSGGVSVAEES